MTAGGGKKDLTILGRLLHNDLPLNNKLSTNLLRALNESTARAQIWHWDVPRSLDGK